MAALQAPGPRETSTMPGHPVSLASATAMKPAPPSWRQVTRSIDGCACSASSSAM
jgi:hypothetical protein